MSKINLSKIGFFNPGRLSDSEVELGFIARQGEFKSLLDAVLSYEPGEVPQHYVLIGQRGMGKTTLLVRLAVELKKSPHKERFLPLQYPEEQYNIDRLSKFWLNSLDALADTLDLEGKKDQSRELDSEIKKLSRSEPQEIYPIFLHWVKKLGRCPVLMVDNLNLIFDKISTEDQHRLRAILMSDGAPILIGASASTIKQTVEYGEPFYDAFQIKYLKKLTLTESIEVLKNLARITDKPLHAAFSKNRGRIATFHQLTGGTPRTLSMLFPLVSDGFSEEIQTDLDAILDIITPLYKARFEELSDQMQVILDAIALHWDPISLEDTRNITQLSNAKLSPQLKRLMDVGWIQKSNPGKGKGALYEISERFFNIWYLMRRSSRRQKRELYCLSKFLEVFYGDSLDSVAGNRLAKENISINDAYLNLALAEVTNTEETKSALQAMSYKTLLADSQTNPEILKELGVPEDQILAEVQRQYVLAIAQIDAGHFDKALRIVETLLRIDNKMAQLHYLHGFILNGIGQFEEAEEAYKRALTIDPNHTESWNNLGNIYQDHLERFDDAKRAYNEAIIIDPNYAHPWNGLGNYFMDILADYSAAESAYKKAIEIDSNFASPWNGLGNLYKNYLKRPKEAEMAYKKAIKIDPDYAHPWNGLGNLYKDYLSNPSAAETAYKKAIEIDDQYDFPWSGLAKLYLYDLKKFNEAEVAINKAVELNPKFYSHHFELGNFHQLHSYKFTHAKKAYKKAIELNPSFRNTWHALANLYNRHLQNYDEALRAYKQAIKIDATYSPLWAEIASLYHLHLNNPDKAIEAYKESIKLDKYSFIGWYGLAHVYHVDKLDYKMAEEAYLEAIKIKTDDPVIWNSIGNLYLDGFINIEKSKKAYLRAIELNPSDQFAKYNLISIYRDQLGQTDKALDIFKTLEDNNLLKDARYLHKMLFQYLDGNVGIAKVDLLNALSLLENEFSSYTRNDWYRTGAMAVKLGYGHHFTEVLEETGHDIILRPYYEAIKALMAKNSEVYFTTVAAEVREPAAKILEFMKRYIP